MPKPYNDKWGDQLKTLEPGEALPANAIELDPTFAVKLMLYLDRKRMIREIVAEGMKKKYGRPLFTHEMIANYNAERDETLDYAVEFMLETQEMGKQLLAEAKRLGYYK